METYKEMRERQQAEVNALPIAFAFTEERMSELLAEWGITEEEAEAGAISYIGNNGFIRTSDEELVINAFARIRDERQAAIKADTTGTGFIYQMFLYELNNHEFSYTQEVDDTLNTLGITDDELNSNPALKAGLIAAIDKINAGRDPFDD